MPGFSLRWSEVRDRLASLDADGLVALIHDLYDYAAENRTFLAARLAGAEEREAILEAFRREVISPFYPEHGPGDLRVSRARRAIRSYRRATGDLRGAIDLMVTYVETGTRFTREFGEVYEAFYHSLTSMFDDAIDLLSEPAGQEFYPLFRERLRALADQAQQIAWGLGEHVAQQVARLEGRAGQLARGRA